MTAAPRRSTPNNGNDPRLALVPAELRRGRSGSTGAHADVTTLMDALDKIMDRLHSVGDLAQAIVSNALDRIPSSAGYVMLADDSDGERVWRVAGGVGMRSLERRLQLTDGHWLIRTVIGESRSILVDGTDIARAQLAGVPLAARYHLMVVTFPGGLGLVVLGRDGKVFVEGEMIELSAIAGRWEKALTEAVRVRSVARRLEQFFDYPD